MTSVFGLRGRRGELPLRQAVALGEVLGHRDRVLAGEQELVPAPHLPGDRLGHGRRRVAAERAHVGHVEVEVGVPVDVGEVRALAMRHPDGRVVVEIVHPRHRHAARHRAPRPLPSAIDRGRSATKRAFSARASAWARCGSMPVGSAVAIGAE
jgi:hypothetical protein